MAWSGVGAEGGLGTGAGVEEQRRGLSREMEIGTGACTTVTGLQRAGGPGCLCCTEPLHSNEPAVGPNAHDQKPEDVPSSSSQTRQRLPDPTAEVSPFCP